VLEDIRQDTEEARLNPGPAPILPGSSVANSNSSSTGSITSTSSLVQQKSGKANGAAQAREKGKAVAGTVNGVAAAGSGHLVNGVGNRAGRAGLAVPKTVIEEGVRITRECLELVCEVEE